MIRRRLVAPMLAAMLLGGCVVPPSSAVLPNPYPPPPPRLAEVRPKAPDSDDVLIWRPGSWEWVGTGYVWQPGDYEVLGNHSNEYFPGHWAFENGSWNWVRSHWL